MNQGVWTVIYPGKDIEKAKALFTGLLGAEPYADTPYYVGYKVAGQDIGLDPNGHKMGMTGPAAYYNVTDITRTLNELLDAGAQLVQEARDVGGGKLVASVKDPDDNMIGLIQMPA